MDLTTSKKDTAVFRCVQLADKNFQQYSGAILAASCKVADVYEGRTLNDFCIKNADESISHSLRHY